jgi:hypothetical protein
VDSLVKDSDATIPLSISRDGESEKIMPLIPLVTDNHQALADSEDHFATNYNTTVLLSYNNLGTERNDMRKRFLHLVIPAQGLVMLCALVMAR